MIRDAFTNRLEAVHDGKGLSIRFVREWKPEKDQQMPPLSCRTFGHTFEVNPNEPFCNVCGAYPPPKV